MKVFHGYTSIVDKPLANIGRNHLDFGKRFYLTTLENQAISWGLKTFESSRTIKSAFLTRTLSIIT